MAKLTVQEILDAIDELTVLELNELVEKCEENMVYPLRQELW